MSFSVTDDTAALTAAINGFNAAYHVDYFTVRTKAVDYLSEPPSTVSASRLALALIKVLESWGTGKRGAPACRPVDSATEALCNPAIHQKLTNLANSFEFLSVANGTRSLKVDSPFETVDEFDGCLIESLNELAAGLLVGNTNVTYPMKALLLITGLMPAYDSQVRGGLAVAGVSGVNRTRYLLPVQDCPDAKKICVLPFYIGDCISRTLPILNKAIENSSYPMLKGQHGRLFDVLLFVQRNLTSEAALISFSAAQSSRRWYAI
ncbi:hypothetical protein [Caballeronia telluris]|uniref:Uncharacterized protein n=1 Tax=Caballeronia telluris TaxID=326475 RepID=A0A158FJ93_9BURK|nr:hypothetical protein [Caballeronia telluris]SAL19723.1 hypothetical protein AWB66_00960 [Caballeronia telluris]